MFYILKKINMKRFLIILSAVFLLCSFTNSQGIDDVINGIKSGNAASVSKFFDNTVEISVSGKSNNYSKSQGEAVLRDFFTNNIVKSFSVVHQGESGGAQFCIGTLVTNHGTFRTTVNLKQKGDKSMLQEIKFEN
jgi:Domain of unknown function (DUF4783)